MFGSASPGCASRNENKWSQGAVVKTARQERPCLDEPCSGAPIDDPWDVSPLEQPPGTIRTSIFGFPTPTCANGPSFRPNPTKERHENPAYWSELYEQLGQHIQVGCGESQSRSPGGLARLVEGESGPSSSILQRPDGVKTAIKRRVVKTGPLLTTTLGGSSFVISGVITIGADPKHRRTNHVWIVFCTYFRRGWRLSRVERMLTNK